MPGFESLAERKARIRGSNAQGPLFKSARVKKTRNPPFQSLAPGTVQFAALCKKRETRRSNPRPGL